MGPDEPPPGVGAAEGSAVEGLGAIVGAFVKHWGGQLGDGVGPVVVGDRVRDGVGF